MENPDTDKDAKKAAMKELRLNRKEIIAAATATMKIQKKELKAIKAFLKSRAATIPDIAEGTGMPKDKTLFYMATLKKYGQVIEDQKEGAFFKYSLNEAN